jgi:chromosome segregation ATPase
LRVEDDAKACINIKKDMAKLQKRLLEATEVADVARAQAAAVKGSHDAKKKALHDISHERMLLERRISFLMDNETYATDEECEIQTDLRAAYTELQELSLIRPQSNEFHSQAQVFMRSYPHVSIEEKSDDGDAHTTTRP